MKLKYIVLAYFLVGISSAKSAEPNNFDVRSAIAQNLPVTPVRLVNLCDEYFSAVIASLNIPYTLACLPQVDVARFIFEGTWWLTNTWLGKQPRGEEIRFIDAVTSALSEQEQCNF